MKRILITGGTGFVGTNLALYFAEKGYHVTCVDPGNRAGSVINARKLLDKDNVVVIRKTIQEYVLFNLPTIDTPFDYVLNCAAQSGSMKGFKYPEEDLSGNVQATLSALRLCEKYGTPFIHWSSNKVYPSSVLNKSAKDYLRNVPNLTRFARRGVYGCTKLMSEYLVHEMCSLYGIPFIINRFSCMAGLHQYGCADQAWLSTFLLRLFQKKPITIFGDGEQVRDVLNVRDVCWLIEKQMASFGPDRWEGIDGGRWYNIGGGPANAVSLKTAVDMMISLMGLIPEDYQINYDHARLLDQNYVVCSNGFVSQEFEWEPKVKWDETIDEMIHAYRRDLDNPKIGEGIFQDVRA